jgi:hypothetical protein
VGVVVPLVVVVVMAVLLVEMVGIVMVAVVEMVLVVVVAVLVVEMVVSVIVVSVNQAWLSLVPVRKLHFMSEGEVALCLGISYLLIFRIINVWETFFGFNLVCVFCFDIEVF